MLAAHHRLEFERFVLFLGLRESRIEFRFEAGVFLREFGHRGEVARGGFQFLVGLQQRVERLDLPDDALRLLLIDPEIRLALLGFELVALRRFSSNVKESPVAGSAGSRDRRYVGAGPDSSRFVLPSGISGHTATHLVRQ